MGNDCQIIIKKGQNTGKKCSEVNRWCKHSKKTCPACGKEFMYKHSFSGHQCKRSKVNVTVKRKKKEPVNQLHDKKSVAALHNMVRMLQKEVKELREQPTIHIDNVTVITDDIFSKMSSEMGCENAVKFLMEAMASETECLDVVNKVYLSGPNPDQYPIACKDRDHFRFLGPGSNVIDDRGGKLIVSKLTESVQNAMIKASSELIDKYNDPDELMDQVNLIRLQEKLTRIPTADNQARFKRELAVKVSNPKHPFFQED